ncbi:hypothetical protein [Tenacibaculum litopenaei]|uniref:hypothetical protein n=1 Tax=Tenacibaculum litopenaei TaxID=396016 RepID=UPI0038B577B5
MKNIIKTLGKELETGQLREIQGGNFLQCIACMDNCRMTSRDRIELGNCMDNCRAMSYCQI